jgi:amino acid adenylation domain-containing protein
MMNIYQYFGHWKESERTALHVDGKDYSYASLERELNRIAHIIQGQQGLFVGILASRSLSAYASVLAILKAGKAYVPLNPSFPAIRNLQMTEGAGLNTIVVGKEGYDMLTQMYQELPVATLLIFPDSGPEDVAEGILVRHKCHFISGDSDYSMQAADPGIHDYAYMLFTSGSTGKPKGVPITHGNVEAYVDYLVRRYKPVPEDRFSQTFDLTFDLSVHDMFISWASGASLYSIPGQQLLMPAHFIRKHNLTMWFSVPSMARYMDRFKLLKPGAFPSLRISLFCGEALPLDTAQKWQAAAPDSVIENIYGPTEATIGISHYRLESGIMPKTRNGIVSMGRIFDGQEHLVLNDDGQPLEGAGEGELCLGGSQLCSGYWQDEERSRSQFFTYHKQRYYRSGDLVYRDEDGDLFFLSRKDLQVKVRGYRVELEEVSHALGQMLGSSEVVTLAGNQNDGTAESLVCFVLEEYKHREGEILPHLSKLLPDYMLPGEIRFVESFPLNENGKIDRKRLESGE